MKVTIQDTNNDQVAFEVDLETSCPKGKFLAFYKANEDLIKKLNSNIVKFIEDEVVEYTALPYYDEDDRVFEVLKIDFDGWV